ncbi:hypothetical protein LHJ74_21295 [Streptomyces sp. N2-109]|uniref:Small secreted protein n=1 Tax=Streptomyces gossypii TaxID=2883101 RepID=A0ABT2JWX7_9ACTN|nr:hypothetical protein [Streptomyces gossypii]MCT2592409.1 hypothetical protein [Streptomyces gossypii]
MFRRVVTGVALSAAVSLAVVGCSSAGSPGEAPEVTWAGNVCEHLSRNGSQLRLPAIDQKKPQQAKKRVVAFLDGLATQLGSLEKDMKKEGAPPVEDGKQSFTKAMEGLSQAKQEVDGAVTSVRESKVDDEKSLNAALAKAGEGFRKAGRYQGPAQELRADPALKSAFDEAEDCAGIPVSSAKPATAGN